MLTQENATINDIRKLAGLDLMSEGNIVISQKPSLFKTMPRDLEGHYRNLPGREFEVEHSGHFYQVIERTRFDGSTKGWEIYDAGDLIFEVNNHPDDTKRQLTEAISVFTEGRREGEGVGRRAAFSDLRKLIGAASE